MSKIYKGRATANSKKLMAQLQFQGEDLSNLSTSELHGILKKQKAGSKDITGGSGNLLNVANQQIKKLNTKYGTEFETFKMPRKSSYTSEGTWKVALQETYMKVQNFLLSPESGTSYYEDDIDGMIKDIEKTLKERKEADKKYREREKTEYIDEKGKKHTRSEYVEYNEDEPEESVYESAKDFYRLVAYLHRSGVQATNSDIVVVAKETIQEHTIISPNYTFNDLCSEALNKLRELSNKSYRKGASRFDRG